MSFNLVLGRMDGEDSGRISGQFQGKMPVPDADCIIGDNAPLCGNVMGTSTTGIADRAGTLVFCLSGQHPG